MFHRRISQFMVGLAGATLIAAVPAPAQAQHRIAGHVFIGIGRGFSGPLYQRYPYPYPWPYGPYGPYDPYDPYSPYGPSRYRAYYGDDSASIRLDVKPKQAEVYVDSYRAGVVDDFDGIFQRLHLQPGERELVLYLDGYHTIHQRIYAQPRTDQKITFTMIPLGPGEVTEPRPTPPPPAATDPGSPQGGVYAGAPIPMYPGPQGGGGRPPQGPPPQGPPPSQGQPPPDQPMPGASQSAFGTLSIRVLPADAEILVDGEHWAAPAGQERLVVELAEGRHRIEVRKTGFETYTSDVQIRRGETNTLNVSLLRSSIAR